MDDRFSEDERQYIKRKKLFETLIATDAWKELMEICKEQESTQVSMMLAPASENTDGVSHAMRTEYRKGAIFGIRLVLNTPYVTIAHAKDIISAKPEKESANVPGNYEQPESSVKRTERDDELAELPDGATVTDLGGSE